MNNIRERIPEYAKDLRLNLDAIAKVESLTPEQLWGTALASALAARNDELVRAVAVEARAHLSEPAWNAARTAAALMGMNNVYYRFVHLVSNGEYGALPARLRIQALANPVLRRAEPLSDGSELGGGGVEHVAPVVQAAGDALRQRGRRVQRLADGREVRARPGRQARLELP